MRPLDIVVPIYRNERLVRACVASLLACLGEIETRGPQLVLINDSPDDLGVDALLRELQEHHASLVTVLRNDVNLGFVRTANLGLSRARQAGHDALLVNSDTQTFPGTLSELLDAASADPQIGFASPRSNNASICSLPHHSFAEDVTPQEAFERWRCIASRMPQYHFAPTAVGFYMFIAHRVLANHGVFREEFGQGYEEENDLVMRASKVGTRAIISNRAFAYHAGSASFALREADWNTAKHENLTRLSVTHPEFLPLVRRYENSPHYQAERLMGGLLKDSKGRVGIVFDLSEMGQHYNGTNEHAVAVIRAIARRHLNRVRLSAMGTEESFQTHGLNEVEGLAREEPTAPGLHAVGIRLAQPFELHHISRLEEAAPVNVFAMLDTIAEDCSSLAAIGNLHELWDHVSEHANGLVYNSNFSKQTFLNRHPAARSIPNWAQLLPTRLKCYGNVSEDTEPRHLLVLGNHFAHKGSEVAARTLAARFPRIPIVALGGQAREVGNLTVYRAGHIEPHALKRFFAEARAIVLPSHVEGFGLGFMHALAAGRPIVARRIPATEEILGTLNRVEGVFLFDNDDDLEDACCRALECSGSQADDQRGITWDDWADGLVEFCLSLSERPDLFERLVRRLAVGDTLRRAHQQNPWKEEHAAVQDQAPAKLSAAKPVDLEALLAMEGHTFVEHAYATLLRRPVDQGGLQSYLLQLGTGTHKVEVLVSLANSPEGRLKGVKLRGLSERAKQLRRARLPLLRRMFTA